MGATFQAVYEAAKVKSSLIQKNLAQFAAKYQRKLIVKSFQGKVEEDNIRLIGPDKMCIMQFAKCFMSLTRFLAQLLLRIQFANSIKYWPGLVLSRVFYCLKNNTKHILNVDLMLKLKWRKTWTLTESIKQQNRKLGNKVRSCLRIEFCHNIINLNVLHLVHSITFLKTRKSKWQSSIDSYGSIEMFYRSEIKCHRKLIPFYFNLDKIISWYQVIRIVLLRVY